jgi:hypothetical protein
MLARTMRPPIELATDSEATARSGVYVLCQILDGKLKAIAQISAPGAPTASRSIRLEANGVTLALRLANPLPYEVLTSSSLTAGSVIVVAANAVVSAIEGPPQIDARQDASVHFDDTPAEIVNVGGVMARPVRSVFQTDEVALRLRWPISWGLRSSAGLAWVSGTTW